MTFKLLISGLLSVGILTSLPVSSAQGQSGPAECRALAASVEAHREEAVALRVQRDGLAEKTELSGETWENAEAERNFGSAQAAAADAAKADYETLKTAFHSLQAALGAKVEQLNGAVGRYNQVCSRRRG
jgi:hypothetical protein